MCRVINYYDVFGILIRFKKCTKLAIEGKKGNNHSFFLSNIFLCQYAFLIFLKVKYLKKEKNSDNTKNNFNLLFFHAPTILDLIMKILTTITAITASVPFY